MTFNISLLRENLKLDEFKTKATDRKFPQICFDF